MQKLIKLSIQQSAAIMTGPSSGPRPPPQLLGLEIEKRHAYGACVNALKVGNHEPISPGSFQI